MILEVTVILSLGILAAVVILRNLVTLGLADALATILGTTTKF